MTMRPRSRRSCSKSRKSIGAFDQSPEKFPHFLTSSLPHFLTSSLPHFLKGPLDMGGVMAAMPRIQRQGVVERHRTEFRMNIRPPEIDVGEAAQERNPSAVQCGKQ